MLSRCKLPTQLSRTASASRVCSCSSSSRFNKKYNTTSNLSSAPQAGQSTRVEPPQIYPAYLQDIDDTPLPPRKRSRKAPIIPSAPRQTMTERESKVLTNMLDLIFASNGEPGPSSIYPDISQPQSQIGAGVGPVQVDDLFRRLRRLNRRKPTTKARAATIEMFDLKKEEMHQCKDDQELLEWAIKEVFDESVRYENAAKQVAEAAIKEGQIQKNAPPLQSPIYHLMIAHLMRTFRDHYHDPNLALYIFNYAQKLSIVSYAFGCSTDSYNELIETRWYCFKDLQGVLDAVKEMTVNAVPANTQTHKLLDRIRHDLVTSDSIMQAENSRVLTLIEDALSRLTGEKVVSRKTLGAWKTTVAEDDKDGFDDWSSTALLSFNPKPMIKRWKRY